MAGVSLNAHHGFLAYQGTASPLKASAASATPAEAVLPSSQRAQTVAPSGNAEFIPRSQDPLMPTRSAAARSLGQEPLQSSAPESGVPPGQSGASEQERVDSSGVPGSGGQLKAANPDQAAQQEAAELAQVRELARIDREVRAHEAAHASVGGAIAGAPSYQLTRGPDGRLYATGGEVSIDTRPVPGDPAASAEKARTIIQAALAPANPSPQDLRVAAQAQALLVEAQAELARQEAEAGSEEQNPLIDGNSESVTNQAADRDSPDSLQPALASDAGSRQRERQEAFAEQHRELGARLNGVHHRLIDAGVIEVLDPEGVFLDVRA